MQLRNYRDISFLFGLLIAPVLGSAQHKSDTIRFRSQLVTTCVADQSRIYTDSVAHIRDSLEIVMLRTTKTYQHIERLLASFPAGSAHLDSLPAVLPVDLPVENFRISSPFGIRHHPIHKQLRFHGGVDVQVPLGMLVKATAPGVVQQVGYDPSLGAFVRLQHAFGFETVYGHLKGYCVRPGQVIGRNEQIGKVGRTGLATGPHLHYSIKKNGSVIDPFQFCFLLRRRLWLYSASSEETSGKSVSVPAKSLSSKGSYPNSRN